MRLQIGDPQGLSQSQMHRPGRWCLGITKSDAFGMDTCMDLFVFFLPCPLRIVGRWCVRLYTCCTCYLSDAYCPHRHSGWCGGFHHGGSSVFRQFGIDFACPISQFPPCLIALQMFWKTNNKSDWNWIGKWFQNLAMSRQSLPILWHECRSTERCCPAPLFTFRSTMGKGAQAGSEHQTTGLKFPGPAGRVWKVFWPRWIG